MLCHMSCNLCRSPKGLGLVDCEVLIPSAIVQFYNDICKLAVFVNYARYFAELTCNIRHHGVL